MGKHYAVAHKATGILENETADSNHSVESTGFVVGFNVFFFLSFALVSSEYAAKL